MDMTPSATVWLTEVLLIVSGQQLSSMALRNKSEIRLRIHRHLLEDQFIIGFGLFVEFGDNKKNSLAK